MVNYQLYRTNVFLSGQVKWDLIIDNVDNELEIKEFQLTPISEKINFNREESDYWLNHSHQDNLKKLYNNISGNFYNHLLDLSLTNNMPFYSNKKQYNDDYIMGCKRMLYSIYDKQFQFFCPVWLEQVSSPVSFFIDICTKSNTLLYRKELKLDYKGKKAHDSFVKYFNDYINYVGLKEGNDKICNIDFKNDVCMYDGVSVKFGLKQRLNLKFMLNQLKDRERPLVMTDNMIIDTFKSSKLIAKQLFNFNLCFNIIDILPNHLKNMMMGDLLNVKVKVCIGGKEIGLRDFYSNYDFIKRSKCDFKRVYGSKVNKDIPPYVIVAREPISYCGINSVGLNRRNFTQEQITAIQNVYRLVYLSGLNVSQAVEQIENTLPQSAERDLILNFIKGSPRGIVRGYN